ncbi:MAG: glutamine-hydrolyzing GMP synthase [Bacteroidota bacterium]|nr:glutamine-hydrolyzing GMP synthase [Bacteroidota bacterium]MEC7286048.1 glutamine-hydrolyzing GMP synthase [Bacteroidota bacterium]MEC7829763.1 glutamine-hydrolyzing GMP synthase [Bacteroidota bacterium]MEC8097940.1 glutamine-hydrolyzing GMP synthase [Bacteroidota bacterium]MEC8363819.1 glutamine-hydrolyzing GMP synthase [Bacteroidota bacterium]|tara:strand:+ start:1278 stop:2804 length:1527 start_codon:yes stop_codon:yes gene_type:complete
MHNKVLILDFGSQYTQLIARRVRELSIYCEILPFNKIPHDFFNYKAVILSGSPFSVRSKNSPKPNVNIFRKKIPILGICYGAQLLAHSNEGEVSPSNIREYGRARLIKLEKNKFFKNVNIDSQVWMSHSDTIKKLPIGAVNIASTEDVVNAAFSMDDDLTFGMQFHPEVYHTKDGFQILKNFLVDISKIPQEWTPNAFIESTVNLIKKKIGNEKVILGLSGGVDSSVAAILLKKAIGNNLQCIFVNNGLLRKNEFSSVLSQYKKMGLNVKGVDSSEKFLSKLKGVIDPESKRKIIGNVFIEVFDDESRKIKGARWLAQGTIYPDIIESISVKGPSATIKSHHNVGGLPDYMKLKIIEPLRTLFKDEVRKVGKSLGLDEIILNRHPFPGPGLAIRILGEVSKDKVKMLQEADSIFINALIEKKLYNKVWQAGVILLPVSSVGVMGDERTYEKCVVLRAVTSTDGMTADWVNLPYEFLQNVSNKIINRVPGINRVTYDISSKPPSTIEWE